MELLKVIQASLLGVAMLLVGCTATVTVDKRPNLALPIYSESITNQVKEYVIVDQGYKVKYSKCGLNTEIQSMSAELTTNKTVKFTLGGLTSTVSTNNIQIKVEDIIKVLSLIKESTNDTIVVDRKAL